MSLTSPPTPPTPAQQDIRRILNQLVRAAFLQLVHAARAGQLNIKRLGPKTSPFVDGDLGPLESVGMFSQALDRKSVV